MTLLSDFYKVEFPNLFSGSLKINRVAFTVFGIDIMWYGVVITSAIILGFIYALCRSKKVGLIGDDVFDVAIWGVLGGFLGARIYYVIFAGGYDIITTFTTIRDGGLAIYGGIIGAVFAAGIAAKIKKVKFLPLLDLAGPAFLIGQGIGRWANFINQEAYGEPTAGKLPWGMISDKIYNTDRNVYNALLEDPNALVHPTFLYESIWCFVGFLLLHFIVSRYQTFDGELFLLYATWYGGGRAWIEGLRTDSLYIGTLRVSQILAILSVVVGVALFIYLKVKLSRNKSYRMYRDTEESSIAIEKYKAKTELEKQKKLQKRKQKEETQEAPGILTDSGEDETAKNAEIQESDEETQDDNIDKPEEETQVPTQEESQDGSKAD
jgi:phosphatidylglycerol:prolipoprotein diacylglycerol transferase